jgi:hypothetical protein
LSQKTGVENEEVLLMTKDDCLGYTDKGESDREKAGCGLSLVKAGWIEREWWG